jgi:hypothetical protein
MASILTKLAQQKTDLQLQSMSKEAYRWLAGKTQGMRDNARHARNISREENRQVRKFNLGGMYYFYYDPKTKDELPYYDVFPMVIILERYPDGFLGLNLHYLPLPYRIMFLDKLLDYASFTPDNEIKRLRVTYDILSATKRLKAFKPCLKQYLYNHVQSKIIAVQPNEWDIATFLPVHQFKKARATTVWQESMEEIKGTA